MYRLPQTCNMRAVSLVSMQAHFLFQKTAWVRGSRAVQVVRPMFCCFKLSFGIHAIAELHIFNPEPSKQLSALFHILLTQAHSVNPHMFNDLQSRCRNIPLSGMFVGVASISGIRHNYISGRYIEGLK